MLNRLKSKLNTDVHFSELIKGSSISFLLRIVGIVFGYIFVLLVTHGYGAEAMGIFAIAFTILQISSVVSRLGMDTLGLRYISKYSVQQNTKENIRKLYKNILFITVPLSILVSIVIYYNCIFIAENIFGDKKLELAIQVVALGILPFSMLFIHREMIRGFRKMMAYSFFNNVSISFFASLILSIFILYTNNILSALYAQLIAIVISALFSFYVFQNYLKKLNFENNNINKKNNTLTYTHMLSIALPMMFSSSLLLIMNWADTIILGIYTSTDEVGIYNVALKVAAITSIIAVAINSISAPKFAQMWSKKDIYGLEKIVKQSTKMIFWLTLPLIIIILLFPSFILSGFGERFEVGVYALIFLIIGQFFNAINGAVGTLLTMTGYQVIVQNVLLFSLIINIVLNLVFVRYYGIEGVAIATMSSTILWNGLMNYFIWKKHGFITFNFGVKR